MAIMLKVKVRSSGKQPLPDWGLGEGILIEQEVDWTEENLKEFGEIRLAMKLNSLKEDLIHQAVECIIEEI